MIKHYAFSTGDEQLDSDSIMLLRDSNDATDIGIEALAASGDCFITLATTLDQYAELHAENGAWPPELESVISTLLYLQRNYKINRKTPEYRQ